LYGGVGIAVGGPTFGDTFVSSAGLNFQAGGGVSKTLTLGVNLSFDKYLSSSYGWAMGLDVEGKAFVYKGLFINFGLGVKGVPKGKDEKSLVAGVGGKAGIGYEFWVNQSSAMQVGLVYDLRAVSIDDETKLRNGILANAQFAFY